MKTFGLRERGVSTYGLIMSINITVIYYNYPAQNRDYVVEHDKRDYIVIAETRSHAVKIEHREYVPSPESRVADVKKEYRDYNYRKI